MPAQPPPPEILAERVQDAAAVDALIDRAFGPGRYAKAAERLRETNQPLLALSRVAWADGQVVGCARLWPVRIGETPGLLLGPLAVEAAFRGSGLGVDLVQHACDAAAKAGHRVVILVGDEAYFARAAFTAAPARRIIMPGSVDQRRVLVRALTAGAADELVGLVASPRSSEPIFGA